jgi:hypothetical protein
MKRLLALALLVAGCQADLDAPREQLALDRPYFDCKVQPVITKLCSGLACHGDDRRFFHVFGRNRDRLGDTADNALVLQDERDHNYAAALAVVDADDPEHSEMLMKPLAEAAGGWFHRGAELYDGGDVFSSADDADYKVIVDWIGGATEMTTCEEPGSTLP